MNFSGWHPPNTDNIDTLYLGDQHCLVRNSAGFSFCLFFHLCLSVNSIKSWKTCTDRKNGSVNIYSRLISKMLDSQSRDIVFKTTQTFILLRSIKWGLGISGNLVVKSKLLPLSGSVALRQLNPIHKKRS